MEQRLMLWSSSIWVRIDWKLFSSSDSIWLYGFHYIATDSIKSFVFKNVLTGFLGMLNVTIKEKKKKWSTTHSKLWARTSSYANNTHADKLENVNSHTCPIIINYYWYCSIRCRLLSSCPELLLFNIWKFLLRRKIKWKENTISLSNRLTGISAKVQLYC